MIFKFIAILLVDGYFIYDTIFAIMKKIKKIVLSILLFTFALLSIHDVLINKLHTPLNFEQKALSCEKVGDASTSYIHECVHTLLAEPLQKLEFSSLIFFYEKQFQNNNLFLSHIESVPQRPPLS